jgi:hypothetical protein
MLLVHKAAMGGSAMKKPEMEKYPVCLYICTRDCLSAISEKLTTRRRQQVRMAFPARQVITLTIRDEALEEWRLIYEKT